MVGEIAFVLVSLFGVGRFVRGVNRGNSSKYLVSGVAGGIYLLALWIPAHLQAAGLLQSKVSVAGLLNPPTGAEIGHLALRWTAELIVIYLGEWAAHKWFRRRPGRLRSKRALNPAMDERARRITSVVLIAIGLAAYLLMPPPSLLERAAQGQGLGTVLRSTVVTGTGLIVYYRGFRRPTYWALAALGAVLLIGQNIRSPLLFLLCAFVAGYSVSARRVSKRQIGVVVLAALAVALGSSVMSGLRANETRGFGLTPGSVVSNTFSQPLLAPFRAGLDTLDGYRLSESIAPTVPSDIGDFAVVVTTYVPHALWPGKPTQLNVRISAEYLHYKASGQFLSPVGYLTLATGGYGWALLALFLISLVATLLARRFEFQYGYAFVVYGWLRYMLGGSSFDIYYVTALALPVVIVYGLVRYVYLGQRRSSPASPAVATTGAGGR